MHIVDWEEAQEADAVLAVCRRWLHTCKDTLFPKRDALLKKYFGDNTDPEEGRALFHVCNSLVLSKGLLYVSTTPKGEAEGILAFVVPTSQHHAALVSMEMQATRASIGHWPSNKNGSGGP